MAMKDTLALIMIVVVIAEVMKVTVECDVKMGTCFINVAKKRHLAFLLACTYCLAYLLAGI